jgi:hypothetical protein
MSDWIHIREQDKTVLLIKGYYYDAIKYDL